MHYNIIGKRGRDNRRKEKKLDDKNDKNNEIYRARWTKKELERWKRKIGEERRVVSRRFESKRARERAAIFT